VVALLARNLDQEFTVHEIKRETRLPKLLSARVFSLMRLVNDSKAGVVIKFREEGVDDPPHRIRWQMVERKP
jgi:hypothetical protein